MFPNSAIVTALPPVISFTLTLNQVVMEIVIVRIHSGQTYHIARVDQLNHFILRKGTERVPQPMSAWNRKTRILPTL